ncbi:MAG: FAD-dependent oxidoreductase [Thermoleophilaceae bacterium]
MEGLEDVPYWTNREATTLAEVPDRVMLVGGGPVAVELSQVMSRFGAQVTLVQYPDRLVNREDPRVGELIEAALRDDGIDVRTGVGAESARTAGGPEGTTVVGLSDGSEVEVDRLVIAAGRTPRIHDIGLETVGVEPGARSLPIDEGCRLAEGLWAVGDATGVAMFTHLAQYQGRVAAANILGGSRRANYRAVPRVVFSDPEIAAVGLSEEAARGAGDRRGHRDGRPRGLAGPAGDLRAQPARGARRGRGPRSRRPGRCLGRLSARQRVHPRGGGVHPRRGGGGRAARHRAPVPHLRRGHVQGPRPARDVSQGSRPRARVSGSPRWLVDGMNVVGSRPDGWWRDRRGAMERLIGLLEDFAIETGEEVTVVFDGRPFPLEPGAVAVAFAPGPGPDAADREIVLRVEADADRASLRVVTSTATWPPRWRLPGPRWCPRADSGAGSRAKGQARAHRRAVPGHPPIPAKVI